MVGPAVSCLLALLLSGEPASSKPAAIAEETQQVKLGAHTFTLPKSLQIDLVAGPPLIERPIHADFDEQGRLYVAESSGSNDPVQKQLAEKPHRIVRLEDTDGDGKFDKRTIFADKLMFPEGLLFYAGSVYVAAPPSIWKLTDTNDDGIADTRVEWFKGQTLTNCANDLHGPYLGPDGWIYWCKGAFARQTYERPGKKPFVTRAAHIFRARPDGTGIEPVMTGGMDNPVELAFTQSGEIIFTTTFFQHPAGGKRDGLIHAIYGGVYGKFHNVIDEHPRTGEVLQPMTHMGPAAPAGICRIESNKLDADYRKNLLVAQFNMHKVSRHILERSGATFKTRDFDLLVSDNLDFHPTDVLEDAEGSVLVVNTGGWYKLCCPSSQLWKPDVLGGIYRIHSKDTRNDRKGDYRGLKKQWKDMPERSHMEINPVTKEAFLPLWGLRNFVDEYYYPAHYPQLRRRAWRELERRGNVDLISKLAIPEKIWSLARINTHEARRQIRSELKSSFNEDDCMAAINWASLNRDAESLSLLMDLLIRSTHQPHIRRAAAEAVGRIGSPDAVPALLKAAGDARPALKDELEIVCPRELEHAITYALIQIADRTATLKGLKLPPEGRYAAEITDATRMQRMALIALDQMENGGLTADMVAPYLSSSEPLLRETAAWISTRHPEWANVLAPVLEQRIADERLTLKESEELSQQLAGFAKSPSIQNLLADVLKAEKWAKQGNAKRIAWQAMSQAPMKSLPEGWFDVLLEAMRSQDPDRVSRAVGVLRKMPAEKEHWPALTVVLLRVAGQSKFSDQLRLDALSALPDLLVSLDDPSLKFVQQHLRIDAPVLQRLAAIDVISRSKLTSEQLNELMFSLQITGPYEFERLLTPYTRSPGDEVLKELIQTLKSSPGIVSVPPEKIQKLFAQGSPEVQKSAAVIISALTEATKKDREKIENILALVPKGDVRRGQLVFHSQKATCTACHALGYVGGRIGPDLSRVGKIRSERDLVESIIYPSASFVRSYEPIVVATKSGKTHAGLIKQESPEDVVVTVSAREEVRLRREEIEEIHPGTVSLMPSGLDQQMTLQELADLVVFLKTTK